MYNKMWESMCEFALTIQTLKDSGWKLSIEYGEQRLGVATRLIAEKNGRTEYFWDEDDIELLMRENIR